MKFILVENTLIKSKKHYILTDMKLDLKTQ